MIDLVIATDRKVMLAQIEGNEVGQIGQEASQLLRRRLVPEGPSQIHPYVSEPDIDSVLALRSRIPVPCSEQVEDTARVLVLEGGLGSRGPNR